MTRDGKKHDFLTQAETAFAGLIARGLLSIVSSTYDSQAFGNASVVLAGRTLRIRLVRDRGDVFADAAAAAYPDDWVPVERMLRAVGVADAPPEGLVSPSEVGNLVALHVADLESGLGDDRLFTTRKILSDLSAEAARRAEQRWNRDQT